MKLLIATLVFGLVTIACVAQNVQADGASAASPSIAAVSIHPQLPTATPAPLRVTSSTDILSESDLRSLLTTESLSDNESDRLYVVRANPLEFKKVCWLPYKRASYTINVPPGSSLLQLQTTRSSNIQGVTVKGVVNDGPEWMHVPILVTATGMQIVSQPSTAALVTLYSIPDTRVLISTLR